MTILDVTMGSFNGAEVCELVGLYLSNKISVLIDSDNISLYRDDRLAVIHNANDPKLDRLRKTQILHSKRMLEYKPS